ncbi:anti-sigma factor [Bacillus sp. FSL K6-3431]|uniref:anti-sigma factor n=1 Tax=Bacillus sp. FSL K6-3431 TaxID=2921500 RepID=UPI0030FD1126
MSDEFKRKLEAFENGQLKGEELIEFEKELAKLEQYQEYLEEKSPKQKLQMNVEKQKKILRRSKWRARFQTAALALGIFIVVLIASIILTGVYYSWGNPDRSDVFTDVIDYTLTVTEPYGDVGSTSSNAKPFFGMEMSRDLNKKVGKEIIQMGELKVNFLFSLMSYPERNYTGNISQNQPSFTYPGFGDLSMAEWDRLKKLPEGTVVSAYLSFNKLVETSDVFQQFADMNFDITWFTVDTGIEGRDDWYGDFIGFPASPIWHDDDMIRGSREEQKDFLFGKVVSEMYSSPDYEAGDSVILHKQFLKTLQFLEKHEKKAEQLYGRADLDLDKRIKYLEKNGIKHYGIVVTGPTKEILKLKEEKLISSVEVDEVGFWNW